jgi:acyl-CoA reductase-like NAD-dependent aldehyde dehydrogenase
VPARVWTNCYHAYPAHAAFGGYKQSGIGRETHKMMLDHSPADEEHAGQLLAEGAWVLLSKRHSTSAMWRTDAADSDSTL